MGNLILVSGPNNSGKSKYAEALIANTTGPRYYIATMIASTDDNKMRIQKHIEQRSNLNFKTLERPYTIGDICIESNSVLLLEDVSNLLANNVFEKNASLNDVYQDIVNLKAKCNLLVAVTITGLETNDTYDTATNTYITMLNQLNHLLAKNAHQAIKMTTEE